MYSDVYADKYGHCLSACLVSKLGESILHHFSHLTADASPPLTYLTCRMSSLQSHICLTCEQVLKIRFLQYYTCRHCPEILFASITSSSKPNYRCWQHPNNFSHQKSNTYFHHGSADCRLIACRCLGSKYGKIRTPPLLAIYIYILLFSSFRYLSNLQLSISLDRYKSIKICKLLTFNSYWFNHWYNHLVPMDKKRSSKCQVYPVLHLQHLVFHVILLLWNISPSHLVLHHSSHTVLYPSFGSWKATNLDFSISDLVLQH